jgi:hypothetical protein
MFDTPSRNVAGLCVAAGASWAALAWKAVEGKQPLGLQQQQQQQQQCWGRCCSCCWW